MSDPTPLAGRSALVVDDEDMVRRVTTRALRDAGADVRDVSTASEALALVADRRFDVLVLDLQMPQMDGTELFGELPDWAQARVVFLSGSFSDDRYGEFLDSVSAPLIAKPVDIDKLVAIIAELIERA